MIGNSKMSLKSGLAVIAISCGVIFAPTAAMASSIEQKPIEQQSDRWIYGSTYKTRTACQEVGLKNAYKVKEWKCVNGSRPHAVPKWNYIYKTWF